MIRTIAKVYSTGFIFTAGFAAATLAYNTKVALDWEQRVGAEFKDDKWFKALVVGTVAGIWPVIPMAHVSPKFKQSLIETMKDFEETHG